MKTVEISDIIHDILKNSKTFRQKVGAVRRDDILVDLEECCKMNIWLQKSASIQPRSSVYGEIPKQNKTKQVGENL